ncbi:MAG: hypothetical protein QME52_11705 [Bacteroidota bacterium]|nr:hypothetical protein [Bacteroidota bacterium]
MNRLPAVIMLFFAWALSFSVQSQTIPEGITSVNYDTIRVATYNILNYPGTTASIRNPHFRRVVHTMYPDILVVQEILSQTGVNDFLSNVLNTYQAGLYSTITFRDGPDTDNHLFFKSSKVAFISASYIPTALREIAEYVVRILGTKDTLRLYSLHLKASQGYETERLAEATILRNHLNNLPAGTKFMVMGDFNIYTSSEPAFQKLIGSEAGNDGRSKDPINQVGNWNNNYSFRYIHTQSPRKRQFGGGSDGGMDDRFDMILTSYSSLDNNIITSRYTAYGNDGNHFNDSINRLPNTAVPDSVANGLHYASDHIPVFCDFKFEKTTGTFSMLSPTNGAVGQTTSGILRWQSSLNASGYDVYLAQNNPPTTIVSTNQADTFYSYSGVPEGVSIYWKIVAKNGNNSTVATGSPWSFTTITNQPGSFSLLSPANAAVNRPINGTLTWNRSTRALYYDIYLDKNNPPITRIDSNLVDTIFTYNNISGGAQYYWSVVAKNVDGNVTASNAPRVFTTLDVPIAPSNISSDSIRVKSIQFSWTDNALNETGYRIFRALSLDGPYILVGNDLPPNSTVFSDTGLQAGQQYFYHVVPFNDLGEGTYEKITIVSLAAVPGTPTIADVQHFSVRLYIDPNENTSIVQYAIKGILNTTEYFLQQDSSLGSVVKWQTYSDWGGANGIRVCGLQPCMEYSFLVKARNTDGIETSYGNITSQQLPCDIVSRSVEDGWNLISVPVRVLDSRKGYLFPTSISEAFSYKGSYTQSESLNHGIGYWLKFNRSENVYIIGDFSWADTIDVVAGWNLIGSVVETLSVANIISEPSDIVTSDYFNYSGTYSRSNFIRPMQGYWVKTKSVGKLILPSVTRTMQSQVKEKIRFESDVIDSFTFENLRGNKQTLQFVHSNISENETVSSELPPLPPPGGFDVRFTSQSDIGFVNKKVTIQKFPLTIQSAAFPVKMRWERKHDNLEYQFVNGQEVKTLDSHGEIYIHAPKNEFSIVVRNKKIAETPSVFTLYQNFPNPFNPSTTISFDLPKKSFVRLVIYNVLGVVVSTLADEVKEGGQYHIPWQPSCASGIFYYRIDITNIDNPNETYQSTKVMTLLK